MGAGLTAMCARNSRDEWPEARGATAQAETLRARIEPLAQADAEVYENALAAFRLPERLELEVRNATLGVALERAAAIPLAIAEVGADVADLAADLVEKGNPRIRETPSPARAWPRRAPAPPRTSCASTWARGRTTSGSSGPMRTPRPPRDPCGARSAAAMSSRPLPAWSRSAGADELRLPVEWPAELTRDWAWGDSTGKDVRVCILDSGIEPSHPRVGELDQAVAVTVLEGDEVEISEDTEGDLCGHGTACAGIVRSLAPDAKLTSVRGAGAGFTGRAQRSSAGFAGRSSRAST